MRKEWTLFLTFLKIGAFTFGGGYGMVSLVRETVISNGWLTESEFLNFIAVSESTPGPLAINSATYVGYKIGGFFGALLSTIGVVIPSFAIIYVISLFLQQFLDLKVVAAAFRGVQVAVAVLILSAGLKLFKEMARNRLTVAIALIVFAVMIVLDVLSLSFSSIWMILMGAAVGLGFYMVLRLQDWKKDVGKRIPTGERRRQKGRKPTERGLKKGTQNAKMKITTGRRDNGVLDAVLGILQNRTRLVRRRIWHDPDDSGRSDRAGLAHAGTIVEFYRHFRIDARTACGQYRNVYRIFPGGHFGRSLCDGRRRTAVFCDHSAHRSVF